MATVEQLKTALVNADAAGDTAAATALARALREHSDYQPKEYQASTNDRLQALSQGMTFGFGDEAASAIRAGIDTLQTGSDFGDNYAMYHDEMGRDRRKFSDVHPGEAFGLELAGGLGTGLAGGAKAFGSKAMSNMPNWLKNALVGGSGGAVYGYGSADRGERTEGAAAGGALGAVITPASMKVLERVGSALGTGVDGVMRALNASPDDKASRVIRKAIEDEGISPDDLIKTYERLGPKATLMDASDNLKSIGRAVSDQSGPGKRAMRNLLDTRQEGQRGRLLRSATKHSGVKPDDAGDFVTAIEAARKEQATPLYQAAFERGIQPSAQLDSILSRPSLAKSLKKAEKRALEDGMPPESQLGLLNRIHYAKQELDDQIGSLMRQGKGGKARALIKTKNELLELVDGEVPEYGKARQLWAGSSELLNAIDSGRAVFKSHPSEINAMLKKMSDSEKLSFRAGAMEAIQNRLDDVGDNHNAVKRLVGSNNLKARMRAAFDSDEQFNQFMREVASEGEFAHTRNVVRGGSPTSQNLKGQEWLEGAAQGREFIQTDMIGKALLAAQKILGKEDVDPALVKSLATRLTSQGMSPADIQRTMSTGELGRQVARHLGTRNIKETRGAIVPLLEAGE